MRKLLNIHPVHSEEIPDEIQHTKERQPDVLKKITDQTGHTYILHIEFQVKDEKEMVYRMAEYFTMLSRLYKIEIRQYVIYLGQGTPKMPTKLIENKMHFQFELIRLSAIDYELLLSASDPREKMLAILGDLKGHPPYTIAENIAKQIIETSDGDFAERRHLNQLSILMLLRNLAPQNLPSMDSIASLIRPEDTFDYFVGQKHGLATGLEKGLEKGLAKGKMQLVKNLLRKTDFSIAKIADLAEVTEYFVKKIKRSLR